MESLYKDRTIIPSISAENHEYIPSAAIIWEAIDGSRVKDTFTLPLRCSTKRAAAAIALQEAKAWIDAYMIHAGP